MKISKHIAKGTQHKVFCEDFIIDEILNSKYRLFGVFDGCSSGKDSHFASAFIAKIVISEAIKIAINNESLELKEVVRQTIRTVKSMSTLINLAINELLSTMILMLVDAQNNSASIVVIGDGLLSINNKIINVEQNNQPDYLAYHLNKIKNRNDFNEYYFKLLKFNNIIIDDITISTDGINSFSKNGNNSDKEIDIVKYFVEDKYLESNKAMLGRKHNILRNKFGIDNLDDIAIVRIFGEKALNVW